MKFSINQTQLQNALSVVSKGIATRSTLPILSGICFDASKDSLTLQATDLELSIQYSVSALVEEEGKSVLPGKLICEIVKNLPDAAIVISTEDEYAQINCDTSSFSIKTLKADDFPGFPQVEIQQEISVPFSRFTSMVRRVSKMVSKDESRPILRGILITFEDFLFKMVATDSYRLATTEVTLPHSVSKNFQAVISGSFLQEIISMPRSDDMIKLALAENQIVVSLRDTVFINRRIEGTYPNYQQLLPQSCATHIKVDVERLIGAVKRVSLLGQSGSPVKFDIDIASQTLKLSAITQDVGTAQEIIPCTGEGENITIAFNCSYVLDGLVAVETQEVILEVQSSLKPGIVKSDKEEKYLYLVMPVRIS